MASAELADAFFQLYAGLTRAYGLYKVKGREGAKVTGRAETVEGEVTPALWKAHLEGTSGLGIVPIRDDNTVRWGVIDIDVYPCPVLELHDKIERLHLPLVIVRSKSMGAHLTCFTSEDVPATLMRSKLMEMAFALGHPKAEIFPKQTSISEGDKGNWLNMPYFDAGRSTRYAQIADRALQPPEFIEYARQVSLTRKQLEQLNVTAHAHGDFADGPPCLQTMAAQGIPQGTRNEAMFAFGVYARLKHKDDWEKQFEEMNDQLCQPPLPAREVVTIIKSLGRKNYVYPCKRHPCVDLCNKDVCKNRQYGVRQPGIDELDVMLGTLRKVEHADIPTWLIDVDGVEVEVSTEQLMNQMLFNKTCIEKIDKWPVLVKPAVWKEMVVERLSNVVKIAAPHDSSFGGRLGTYVEQWLSTVQHARTRDELLLGKPWSEEGITYFRSSDLVEYLERHRFHVQHNRHIWDKLRNIGATSRQFNIKGRCVQTWGISTVERQNEPFDIPEINNREF